MTASKAIAKRDPATVTTPQPAEAVAVEETDWTEATEAKPPKPAPSSRPLVDWDRWNEISKAAAHAGEDDLVPWKDFQAAINNCYPVLVHVDTDKAYPCTAGVVERVLDNWFKPAYYRTFAGTRLAA